MIATLRNDRGFTLMELLVATALTTVVLGGAVAITSQIQNGYRRQIEDSAGEQEARYALDWIGRYLRGVGNNPLKATTSDCPAVNTTFQGIIPGVDDNSITLQSDSNPPDKKIGGEPPDCDQAGEHVTISFNDDTNTIEFLDNAVGANATTRTDAVIEDLDFTYFKDNGTTQWPSVVDESPENIFYVRTTITIRSRTVDPSSGLPATRDLTSTIRVRAR